MSTFQRIGVAVAWTLGMLLAGLLYNEVFVAEIYPLIDTSAEFATPAVWLMRIFPIVVLVLLAAPWLWVIAGAVQDEKTVNRRRVRR
jgi:hypothetical protein